jgi:protein TonB
MQGSTHSEASSVPTTYGRWRGSVISGTIHAVVLLGVFGVLHKAPRLAPYALPGTTKGVQFLTYYSPGSPEHAVSDVAVKTHVKQEKPKPALHTAVAAPKVEVAQAPSAERGTGDSAASGIGDGDINIALQQYFPYPKPDLSILPHGTKGDVVLNAVIDEHGKITELTVVKGFGPPIDDTVIATVKQWSWAPATRNGTPIPSEQELHFHYERS